MWGMEANEEVENAVPRQGTGTDNRARTICSMDEIKNEIEISVKDFHTFLSTLMYSKKVKTLKYTVENREGNSTVCYAKVDDGK